MTLRLSSWSRRLARLSTAWLALAWPAMAETELDFRAGASWGNDQFFGSDGDDRGFTQDLTVHAHVMDPRNDISLWVRHRLVVERTGKRRTDEMTAVTRWLTERDTGPIVWTFGPALGLALSGNYGGAKLQDAWHRWLGNGFTLDNGLPNQYAPHRTGALVGARGGPSWLPYPWLRLVLGSELQAGWGGTGRSMVAFYDALEFESGHPSFRLFLSGGVDAERNWVTDPTLKLPGGYRAGSFYKTAHVRMAARGTEWEVGLTAETFVGGSTGHLCVVYLIIGGGDGFRYQHALRN